MSKKSQELKDRETAELVLELKETRKHLFTLRSQAVTEKLEDPSQIRKARRDVARLLTELSRRRMAEAAKQA